jgi:hypothetical protein
MKTLKSSSPVQNPLDNASSVRLPYWSSRKRTLVVAEYVVEYKGAKVHCKSMEDAARLLERLGQGGNNPEVRPWNAAEFTDFTERLEVGPRRLLAFLLKISPATDWQLRGHLDLAGNKQLAGVLSGVSKVALALDIEPRRVYSQSTSYKSGKPERRYQVTLAFKKAAEEVDWPSEKDLEEESLIPLK